MSTQSPDPDSLSEERRHEIRAICEQRDIDLERLEFKSGVLILTPSPQGRHPDSDDAQFLAGELKRLGFDFVTVTTPPSDDDAENGPPEDLDAPQGLGTDSTETIDR